MSRKRKIDSPGVAAACSGRLLAESERCVEAWRARGPDMGPGAITAAEAQKTEDLMLSILELMRTQRAALLHLQAGPGNGHSEPDC